jgi:hypothetical protein
MGRSGRGLANVRQRAVLLSRKEYREAGGEYG